MWICFACIDPPLPDGWRMMLFGRNLKESRGRQQKGVKCKEFGILLESKSNFAWRDALKVEIQ